MSKMAVSPGVLIAFCGLDGAGKTTQISKLKEALGASHEVVCLKQPSDWFRGNELVRRRLDENDAHVDAHFLSLFSAADRLLQMRSIAMPALQKGAVVVMDRYVFSAYAYMAARGVNDAEWLRAINKFAPRPDLVVYLDMDPALSLTRVIGRDGESKKKEEQDIGLMNRVRQEYLRLAQEFHFVTIDGALPAPRISQTVLEHFLEVLENRRLSNASRPSCSLSA